MFPNVFSLFEDSTLKSPLSACLCAPPMKGRAYYPDGFEINYHGNKDSSSSNKSVFSSA